MPVPLQTHVLHEHYTNHRAYYAASTLGGAPLGCPQRAAAAPEPPAALVATQAAALSTRVSTCASLPGLTHADQRITEDVEKFAHTVSELYSYTFKP